MRKKQNMVLSSAVGGDLTVVDSVLEGGHLIEEEEEEERPIKSFCDCLHSKYCSRLSIILIKIRTHHSR